MARPIFDDLNEYLRPARLEYREECERIAREAIAECGDDDERLEDWLHETIDGHEWVIITFKAQFVALVSECDALEAACDMLGDSERYPEVLAHCAMNIDVREWVRRIREREAA